MFEGPIAMEDLTERTENCLLYYRMSYFKLDNICNKRLVLIVFLQINSKFTNILCIKRLSIAIGQGGTGQ